MLYLLFLFALAPNILTNCSTATGTKEPGPYKKSHAFFQAYQHASTIELNIVPRTAGKITHVSLSDNASEILLATKWGHVYLIDTFRRAIIRHLLIDPPLFSIGLNANNRMAIVKSYLEPAATIWHLSPESVDQGISLEKVPEGILFIELSGNGKKACLSGPLLNRVCLVDIIKRSSLPSVRLSQEKYTSRETEIKMAESESITGIGLDDTGDKLLVQYAQKSIIYDTKKQIALQTIYHALLTPQTHITWNNEMDIFAYVHDNTGISTLNFTDKTNILRKISHRRAFVRATGMSGNGDFIALAQVNGLVTISTIQPQKYMAELSIPQRSILFSLWYGSKSSPPIEETDLPGVTTLLAFPPHIIAGLCSSTPLIHKLISQALNEMPPLEVADEREHRQEKKEHTYRETITTEEPEMGEAQEETVDLEELRLLETSPSPYSVYEDLNMIT